MPFDQQIVEDDVDDAADQVGRHGELCVSASALGGIDDHGDDIEKSAAHDDPEINDRRLMRVRVAARRFHHPGRKHHKKHGHDNTGDTGQDDRRQQDLVGGLPALLPLPARDQGGNRHVDTEKDRQSDELGLVRQSDRGDGIAAERGHHHGVDHAGKCHKKALCHCRPGNGQGFFCHGTARQFCCHVYFYLIETF